MSWKILLSPICSSLSHCTTKLNKIHSNYDNYADHACLVGSWLDCWHVVVGESDSVSPASTFVRVVQLVCRGHSDLFFIQCTVNRTLAAQFDSNYLPVVLPHLVWIQAGCYKSGHERL